MHRDLNRVLGTQGENSQSLSALKCLVVKLENLIMVEEGCEDVREGSSGRRPVAAHNPKGAWGVSKASYWNRLLKVEKERAR